MPMQDPAHPGLIIRHECIEPLGLSIAEAAVALGAPAGELSDVVAGRVGLSPEMAIRVSKVFGGSARSWYRMQAAYDIAQAEKRADEISVASQLWPTPERAAGRDQHHADGLTGQTPPLEYDARTATLSVPVKEIVYLYSGTIAATEVMTRQLTALESVNVLLTIGANGLSAQDLNKFGAAASVMGSLGQFIGSLTSPLAAESPAYQYDSQAGNIAIPVAEVIQLQQGLHGAARAINCFFDEMEKHQVSGAIGEDAFSSLEDLARAEYIVEAWDAFVQNHPDIPDTAKSATGQAASPDDTPNIESLFREIGAFLRANPLPRLAVPPAD